MSFSMRLSEQPEVAGSVAVNLEWARRPAIRALSG
jgi:2-methylfumaryl-CoA hydratase